MSWGIRCGSEAPTWGAVWVNLGRLRLIWCAPDRSSSPGHPNIPGHPNVWMVVWRRQTPEWDPQTKWKGSNTPGRYWKGCAARLDRLRGLDDWDARCKFPKCGCLQDLERELAERKERRVRAGKPDRGSTDAELAEKARETARAEQAAKIANLDREDIR
jgi:hypothetical protein